MAESIPLYARVIGAPWTEIAEPVRCLHGTHPVTRARGRVRVEHGHNPLACFLVWMLGLPPPSTATEVRLTVTARGDGEQWERTFDGRRLDTRQYESHESELAERFGVLEFRYRLHLSGGSLRYVQREAAFLLGSIRMRIPARWAPRVEAREDPAGPKRVSVSVRVALPGLGPLIAYDGIVVVEDART